MTFEAWFDVRRTVNLIRKIDIEWWRLYLSELLNEPDIHPVHLQRKAKTESNFQSFRPNVPKHEIKAKK